MKTWQTCVFIIFWTVSVQLLFLKSSSTVLFVPSSWLWVKKINVFLVVPFRQNGCRVNHRQDFYDTSQYSHVTTFNKVFKQMNVHPLSFLDFTEQNAYLQNSVVTYDHIFLTVDHVSIKIWWTWNYIEGLWPLTSWLLMVLSGNCESVCVPVRVCLWRPLN